MSWCPYGQTALSLNDTQVVFKFSNNCIDQSLLTVDIMYNAVDLEYFMDKSYSYHIHQSPVQDNNCTSTLAHYDPYKANRSPEIEYVCNKDDFSTCEKGDLSGKHGPLKLTEGNVQYVDPTLTVNEIIGLSIVIHAPDKSRIACNNIEQIYP